MIRFFKKIPRKRKIQLGIILLVIIIVAGILIANKFFNIFAAGNDITNTATIYYQEGGVDKSAQSNTVTTTVTTPPPSPSPTGTTINLNLKLQGRTDFSTTNTDLKVFIPGTTTLVFEQNNVATDASGNATVVPTGLNVGSNYDFKIKVNMYLVTALTNKTFSNPMTLFFRRIKRRSFK